MVCNDQVKWQKAPWNSGTGGEDELSYFLLFSPMRCTERPRSGNTLWHATSIFFALGFQMSTLTTLLSHLPYTADVHPLCNYISHTTASHLLWSQFSSECHRVSARCWLWLPPLSGTFPQHMKRPQPSEATLSVLHGWNSSSMQKKCKQILKHILQEQSLSNWYMHIIILKLGCT